MPNEWFSIVFIYLLFKQKRKKKKKKKKRSKKKEKTSGFARQHVSSSVFKLNNPGPCGTLEIKIRNERVHKRKFSILTEHCQ